MTAFEPMWLAAAMSALGTASGIAQSVQQDKVQRRAQALQASQAQAEIDVLERQRAEAEEDRRDRLQRATAAQRAAFAAGGVSADGSGEAVFGNLLAEADAERRRFDAEVDRRIQGLQSGIQMNLLRGAQGNAFGRAAAVADFGTDLIGIGRKAGWFKKP